MGWRIFQLNRKLREFDRRLSAVAQPGVGTVIVIRTPDRLEASDFHQVDTDASARAAQFILALTDNWQLSGKPQDIGWERVRSRLSEMDSWRDPGLTNRMRQGREQEQENKTRAKRNELRAIAADMRPEFARATNEINTASLEKTDSRRLKENAYS